MRDLPVHRFRLSGRVAALTLLALLATLATSACEDARTAGCPAPDALGAPDGASAEADDGQVSADTGAAPDLAGYHENCSAHADCERGLFCPGMTCMSAHGCAMAGRWLYEYEEWGLGCLVNAETIAKEDAVGQGQLTSGDCETDAECAASPYGPYCVTWLCTDLQPCRLDSDCRPPAVCRFGLVCAVEPPTP